MSERPITPFASFESPAPRPVTVRPALHIPGPPAMPTGLDAPRDATEPSPDPLVELGARVATLSDALLSPEGVLYRLFAAAEQANARRHEETMRTLTHLANGLCEVREAVARLEPEQELQGARLTVVERAIPHAANGAGE